MSYILEALRKADAERQRGSVPGLNTPSTPPLPSRDPAAPRGGRHLALAAAALAALLLLGLLAWQFSMRPAPSGSAVTLAQAPAEQVPAAAPRTLPAPPAAVAVAPAPVRAPAPAPAPARAPAAAVQPPPTVPASPAAVSAASAPAAPAPARAGASSAAQAAARNNAPAPAVAPAVAPEPRIPSQGELPDDLRNRLPKLAISGASYSENPAHRMLIIGGQIYREGEEPAPGLTLEKIAPKEATLNYQGYRYRLGYP